MQTLFPVMNELNLEIAGFQGNSVVLAPYTGSKGRVWIDSIPQGADVYIDMAMAGTTPLIKELTPGSHSIRFSCPGFHDTSSTIQAVRGKVVRVMGELDVEETVKKTGTLSLASVPSAATVRNDKGQVIGETPLFNFELTAGNHILSIEKDGFVSQNQTVSIEGEKDVSYKIDLIPAKDFVATFKETYRTGTSTGMLAIVQSKIAAKDYEGAVTVLKKVARNDEKCIDALYMLGEIYEKNLNQDSLANLYYSKYFRSLSALPAENQRTGDYATQIELVEEAIERVEKNIEERAHALDREP